MQCHALVGAFTMGALHVACALEWNAELLASSDERPLKAAGKAGLKTRKV
jgi:hypothetical protein